MYVFPYIQRKILTLLPKLTYMCATNVVYITWCRPAEMLLKLMEVCEIKILFNIILFKIIIWGAGLLTCDSTAIDDPKAGTYPPFTCFYYL